MKGACEDPFPVTSFPVVATHIASFGIVSPDIGGLDVVTRIETGEDLMTTAFAEKYENRIKHFTNDLSKYPPLVVSIENQFFTISLKITGGYPR